MKRLIADSGSTKTTWCLVETGVAQPRLIRPVHTQGLNPLYATPLDIETAARQVVEQTGERFPDLVQFYGSGCSGARIELVANALRHVFTPQTRIEVASDLLGACRALQSPICCIMGTGSIAARYDVQTQQLTPASSLGYILGDEGSGAWLGRQVLADYLKQQMPSGLRAVFEADYGPITPEQAIQHTYQMPFPNRYLATFASFVGCHPDHSYCQQLAFQGVEAFFVRNIKRLQPTPLEPISFVGSVAYHLQPVIQQVAALHNLSIGKIIQQPIQELIKC